MAAPVLVLLAALSAPPTRALETPRFRIVHTEGSAAAAKKLAAEVEPLRDHVQEALGRDWPGTTEVRLGMGRAEMEALAPEQPVPSWAVGLAWPQLNVVVMEARSLVQGDGQKTFRHELVHVALGRLGKTWPRWFQEGFAQVLTKEKLYDVSAYAALVRAVRTDRVFRFDDLDARFPDRPEDVELAYAQSEAFVRFLFERHPKTAFKALFDATSAGTPFPTAFALAFHTSVGLEEAAFRTQLPSRYPLWPVITMGSSLWALAAVMLVVGWAKRRREVRALRAKQAELEALEDAARRAQALAQAQALGLEPMPPVPEPWEEAPRALELPPDPEKPVVH